MWPPGAASANAQWPDGKRSGHAARGCGKHPGGGARVRLRPRERRMRAVLVWSSTTVSATAEVMSEGEVMEPYCG